MPGLMTRVCVCGQNLHASDASWPQGQVPANAPEGQRSAASASTAPRRSTSPSKQASPCSCRAAACPDAPLVTIAVGSAAASATSLHLHKGHVSQ